MAQKFYNVDKAAEVLGVPPAEVNRLREENRLRGFRDGATWKFKTEDVEQLAEELKGAGDAKPAIGEETDQGDVLLSEVELGGSDAGSSGTVIGQPSKASAADSDIRLADSGVGGASDVKLGGSSGLELASSSGLELTGSNAGSGAGELDLTLDEDITLEDSQLSARQRKSAAKKIPRGGDSAVDLSDKGKVDDDDMVLGGSSGSGSDITIGGDSGISLVDPADSGLSLEEPLELGASGEESLELGEDDMLTLDEQVDSESPTELKKDDEFLLQPLEDVGEEEDSESGSQVIALDSEVGSESPTTIASADVANLPAMLDEDFTGGGTRGDGIPQLGLPGGAGPTFVGTPAEPQAMGPDVLALPETPYSGLVVGGLIACSVLLMLTGWMVFDLMRNMWSWGGPYNATSWLMDNIVGILGF